MDNTDVVTEETKIEVNLVAKDEPTIDEPIVDSFLKSLDKKKK